MLIFAAIVAMVGICLWLGPSRYRAWKHDRLLRQARSYLEKSDFRNAALSVRRAWMSKPSSVDAARMTAQMAEAAGSPGAIALREKVVELEPDVLQNRLDWAAIALRMGDFTAATKALESVGESDRNNPTFQKASAILATGRGRMSEAEAHFLEAARYEPTNAVVQLNLAIVRLLSTNQAAATQARRDIEQLSTNPAVRPDALRDLASDAMKRQSYADALKFSVELNKESRSTFADRILQLNIMYRAKDPGTTVFLEKVQGESVTNAQNAFALCQWMMISGKSKEAIAWIRTMTPEQLARQPLPIMAVECLATIGDWNGIETMLSGQNWGEMDYHRLALRAKVCRERSELTASKSHWLKSVKATDNRLERLLQLARLTAAWDWNVEMSELVNTIVTRYPGEKKEFQALSTWLYSNGKTVAMKNLLTRLAEVDPDNLPIKNNLAVTSLLLDPQDSKAHRIAKETHDREPENPYYASTLAYSLYLQDRPKEALEMFGKLKAEQLNDPTVAAYYAIIMASTGNGPSAKKYLDRARQARLLPEERSLLAKAIAKL